MGSAFHQLYPRLHETLTPTAPMAIRLGETFNYFLKYKLHQVTSKFYANPFCETVLISHGNIRLYGEIWKILHKLFFATISDLDLQCVFAACTRGAVVEWL